MIRRSLKFAEEEGVNSDMAYVVAAYHDIGHHIDAKRHEMVSAEILRGDEGLRRFFSDGEIEVMAEAVEDHRASSDHEPRGVYGRIVSSADRNTSIESCLTRSYTYGKKHNPEMSDEAQFHRAYRHLKNKFGEGGYAKMFFKDEEYERFLRGLRELLGDEEAFVGYQKRYINYLKEKGEL